MATSNPQAPLTKLSRRAKLDMKRCVVCGSPPAGYTGYVFYRSGRTKIGAPFCQEHLETCPRFANPIFEDPVSVELFAKKHPEEFAQYVRGKPLVFFTKIGYHAMTAE